MLKKILTFTIIILVLIAVAIGIQLYLDRTENPSLTEPNTEQGSGIFGFLGFGNNTDQPVSDFGEIDDLDTPRPTTVPTLRKITEEPVAGATFVGTSTIRYVARGNGHIYDTTVNSFDIEKISNTTIPKIYRAFFLTDKENIVYQQLEGHVVKSRLVEVQSNSTTTPGTISTTSFLPDNIRDIVLSPETNEFAYINDSGLVTFGASSFNLPGSSWKIDWKTTNQFVATTRANSDSSGYSYLVSRGGSLEKILGDLVGLTTKSNAEFTLYSSGLNLSAIDSDGNSVNFESSTLPEKCVLLDSEAICGVPENIPAGDYPDSWYQGLVSFDDIITSLDLTTGEANIVYTPGENIDVIWPQLSTDGKYLLFVNKKDLTLWVLNLDF